jgi:predicted nucleic acid-binding protein
VHVIDTSAFAKFLLREPGWQEIIPFLEPEASPRTVEILAVEMMNVIWKYARNGAITEDQGIALYGYIRRMIAAGLPVVEENAAYGEDALHIAFQHDIPVYDALFLAQAEARTAPLVTADRIQADVAAARAIPCTRLI